MSIEAVIARVAELQGTTAPTRTGLGDGTGRFGRVLDGQFAATGVAGVPALNGATGGAGARMVSLAQAEIGVREEPPGSNDGARIRQYRSATAGSGVGPWCAYFTSWLAKSAGAPVGEQGQGFGSVDALYGWAQRTGRATANGPGVHPNAGDLIVFDEHIGLVESVDADGTVHTIEGNSSDQVTRRTHPQGAALGYVRVG